MILIDSNVPMYLVGASHPHKIDAQRVLERCIADNERLVTDAEVLQEILHRYVAIGRKDAIQPAFQALLGVVDEVIPIELRDVERAKEILLGVKRVSARDALHLAIMERNRISTILSFDSGFDGFPGVTRLRGT
ncbi:MAG: PIN domain-containing protein [Proteobacteria bacterium]|nr:PIN domain-containing protein [Pseudomonadota bacterium]NIT01550.1 PIN domain-containing protein [Candidatus Latescibacterota bacterium]